MEWEAGLGQEPAQEQEPAQALEMVQGREMEQDPVLALGLKVCCLNSKDFFSLECSPALAQSSRHSTPWEVYWAESKPIFRRRHNARSAASV